MQRKGHFSFSPSPCPLNAENLFSLKVCSLETSRCHLSWALEPGLRQASRQAPHSSSATAVLPLLPSVLVRTSLLVAGLSPAKALLQSPPPEDLALPLTSYSMSRRSPPLLLHASPWRSPRFSLPKESIVIPASPGSQVSSKDRVLLWHPPSGCRPSPDPIPRILHGTQHPQPRESRPFSSHNTSGSAKWSLSKQTFRLPLI